MKLTLNRAKKLNKTCEITTCVSRDWPPCNQYLDGAMNHGHKQTDLIIMDFAKAHTGGYYSIIMG